MSGVEIAGFLLAAFSLLISAHEHYRESAEVLEGWWKIKREYKKCMWNLKYHRLVFEENLEELLLPLIANEDKLQRLLRDPGGSEWEDPQLEEIIRARLPKTYSVYLETMKVMEKTIEELDATLGTNKIQFQDRIAGKAKLRGLRAHVTSNIGYHGQVIKIAFSKTVLNQLFEDFGSCNARLRDILGASDRLATLRRSRKTTAGKSVLSQKFWEHGSNIFKLLTEAWSCRCQSFHHANLVLQHRIAPSINFRVLFWFKSHLAVYSQPLPWCWQETSICLLEDPTATATIKLQVPQIITSPVASSGARSSQLIPEYSPFNANTKTVASVQNAQRPSRTSFMKKWRKTEEIGVVAVADCNAGSTCTSPSSVPSAPSPMTTSTVAISASSTTLLVSNGSSNRAKVSFVTESISTSEQMSDLKIADLCTKIATCSPDLPKYGCLKNERREYVVQPLCKASTEPQEHISLSKLLHRTTKPTRRQRFHIALILASSFVQLYPTPWLHPRWSKKDILFLCDVNDKSKICTDWPYISRPLSKALQNNPNSLSLASSQTDRTFQESIHNLGIMLLELCFGKAIEDHELCASISATDDRIMQVFIYGIASDWAQHVVEEAGPDYSDAVNWCLQHKPENTVGDGQDEKWREDMIARVVEPLKNCHDQLMAV